MEDIYSKTKNLVEKIPGLDFAELSMNMVGFQPSGNYTIDDLMELEEFINNKYPGNRAFPALFLPIGWYYGKTIIKNLKGSYWIGDGKDVFGIGIECKSSDGETVMRFFPFVRARKFLKNREDGLVCFFEMNKFLLNGGMEKMQDVEYLKKVADKDGWVHFPEDSNNKGFKIRLSAIIEMHKN